ncbi:unnamed protein product, partial [Rotaria sp. Silwood2]
RTTNVRAYFLEDISQLLSFQPINSTSTNLKQINKNQQLEHDDNGYHQWYKRS